MHENAQQDLDDRYMRSCGAEMLFHWYGTRQRTKSDDGLSDAPRGLHSDVGVDSSI